MRQGGEPQGVQVVRQGEPTPYHCDFNALYKVQAAFEPFQTEIIQQNPTKNVSPTAKMPQNITDKIWHIFKFH